MKTMAYRRKDQYYEKKLNELREYEASFGEGYDTFQKMGLPEFKHIYNEAVRETNATQFMKDAKWGINHDISRKTFRELSKFLHEQEKEKRAEAEWGSKKNVKHYGKKDIENATAGGTTEFVKAHRSELKKLWRSSEMAEKMSEGQFYTYYLFGSR